MAITAGTTSQIIPSVATGGGTAQSATIVFFSCKASEAFRVGDIVVMASGVADAVDAAQTDSTILGVAMQAKTAGGTVSSSDLLAVALALPGASFTGSMVGSGGTADHTPSATAATEAAFAKASVDTVLGDVGYICLDGADVTGGQCQVYRFSDAQLRGQRMTLGAVLPLNPRVDFVFRTSFFLP